MKRVLSFALVLVMVLTLLPISAFAADTMASGTCGENLTWSLDSEGTLTISGTGDMNEWAGGGAPWYAYKDFITTVVIKSGVTRIGGYAFWGCESLTSVSIPNSVTSIESDAFRNCNRLTSITIPKSVISIGDRIFWKCSSLTSISVASDNNNYSSQDGVLYNKNKTTLIRYPEGNKSTSFTIPNSVTCIEDGAFRFCSRLTSITIPNSVTSIGICSFGNCYGLTSVQIPNSVTRINDGVFYHCSSLTSISVASNNKNYSSQNGVLLNKNKTTLIQYPIGNTSESYTIPNSVTSISDLAFKYCNSLTSVVIPNSVISIGSEAFENCSSLTDIYYSGTEAQWKAIYSSSNNATLLNATIHFANKTVPVTYEISDSHAHETNRTAEQDFYYSDDFFKPASSKYNHDLAIMSLGMAMASVNNDHKGNIYIDKLMNDIDCSEVWVSDAEAYKDTTLTTDKCEFTYGLKYLPELDEYLVPLVIRSCNYGGEWASNCRVYGSKVPNYSQGFKLAADGAYAKLAAYIKELNGRGIDSSKINVWVMGFSRGGAVSNLIGADLNENLSKTGLSKDNIFVYTFATPNTVKKSIVKAYSNIHNIVSQIDIVPRVPLATSGWDYTRYGITHYLPCHATAGIKYNKLLKNMQSEFDKIMKSQGTGYVKYNPINGQEVAIDLLIDYLDDVIHSSNYYEVSGIQRFLSTFAANEYTSGDNDALLHDFIEEVFGNYAFEHKGLLLTTKVNTADFLNYFIENMEEMGTSEKIAAVGYILDDMSYIRNGESDPVVAKKVAELVYNLLSRYSIYLSATLSGNAGAIITSNRFNAYNDLIKLIVSVAKEGRNSSLLMQHWPEEYLAWMRSGDENTVFTTKDYKHTSVKCPVDITVYDGEGNIVARVVNDEVDTSIENALLVTVDEFGEKEIYMPNDDEYRIEVTAREEGTVDIVSEVRSVEGETLSTECYVEMPMVEDQLFVVEETPEATNVQTENKVVEPDCTADAEPSVFAITAEYPEGGSVSGAGEYEMGKTVQLIPIADEGYRFTGWYENGELISTDETLRFSAVADRTVSAKFEKHNHNWSVCEQKDASCTEKGYIIYNCSGCTKLKYDEHPTTDHVFENGVCTVCGEADPNYAEPLAAPTITLSNVASTGKIKITWTAVEGAAKYEIWRATSKDGEFTRLSTASGTSLTNTSTTAGKTYYYRVRAVSADGTLGDFSDVKYRVCDCAQPVVKLTNVASSGKIKISWSAITGATKYEVWRSTSKTGTYTKISTTTGTSITNTSAVAGKTYYYKVKAICGANSSGNSAFSSIKSITCDCARPVVKITTSSGHPKLSWAKVEGATKYEVYRATSKDGTYKKISTTTKLSLVNSNAVKGKTYYYKVKAVCGATTAGNSAYSTVVSIKAK